MLYHAKHEEILQDNGGLTSQKAASESSINAIIFDGSYASLEVTQLLMQYSLNPI